MGEHGKTPAIERLLYEMRGWSGYIYTLFCMTTHGQLCAKIGRTVNLSGRVATHLSESWVEQPVALEAVGFTGDDRLLLEAERLARDKMIQLGTHRFRNEWFVTDMYRDTWPPQVGPAFALDAKVAKSMHEVWRLVDRGGYEWAYGISTLFDGDEGRPLRFIQSLQSNIRHECLRHGTVICHDRPKLFWATPVR